MTATRTQNFRAATTGGAPAAGSRLPGETWVNFPDLQIGLIDAAKNPQKLVAVRYFSTTANYAAGDWVVQGGVLYVANGAITAGAFNSANWTRNATVADLPTGGPFLPLTGGTVSGPIVLPGNPTTNLQAATKQYVDTAVPVGGPFLPLSGGSMTGAIVLPANPTTNLQAATKQYVDSLIPSGGPYLPLAGGTLTGNLNGTNVNLSGGLTASGASNLGGGNFLIGPSACQFNPVSLASRPHIDCPNSAAGDRGLYGSHGGVEAWGLILGLAGSITGGNAGLDFALARYSDAGAYLSTPILITRSTGAMLLTSPSIAINSTTVNFSLNKSASGQDNLIYGQTNGSARWALSLGNATAESTSQAGSDCAINSFSDAGAYFNTPIQIKRSTSVVTFAAAIVNGPSDRTLKENIEPIAGALDKVLALDGVRFNFIGAPEKRLGLIAQDVQPICPEVIQPYQTQDSEGKAAETKLAIDYPQLVAVLIEAVKTLTTRVEQLEAAR